MFLVYGFVFLVINEHLSPEIGNKPGITSKEPTNLIKLTKQINSFNSLNSMINPFEQGKAEQETN